MRLKILVLTLLPFFLLLSCTQEQELSAEELQELRTELQQTKQELQDLRQEVQELRQKQLQGLKDIRQDLEQVVKYMQISLDNLEQAPSQEQEDPGPREQMEKSLQKFLDLTDQLLEKMKQELEKELDPSKPKQEQDQN
ncbi:MAG: hypothetical protein R6U22_05730 [Desulfohalobiaceae bacterium]